MPRLNAGFWTSALIRQAQQGGAFAVVIRRGDPDAGACLVKVRTLDGQASLYRPIRNMEGQRVWLPKGPEIETEIDDLWVLEIEDRQGRHFLSEPVETATS